MEQPAPTTDIQKLTATLEVLIATVNTSLTAKKETSLPAHITGKNREYLEKYLVCGQEGLESAHAAALDIRKFEIDLYWKRSGYFWAIIAATITAYGLLLSSSMKDSKILSFTTQFILFGLSFLGCIFSRAWLLVNKGSKFWQANWETQVEILEDVVTGPLYKSVFAEHGVLVDQKLQKARTRKLPNSLHAKIRDLFCLTQPKDRKDQFYFELNRVFAVIYSPTKINDMMAKLFFWLFLSLGLMSVTFLVSIIYPSVGAVLMDPSTVLQIKRALVAIGLLGFALFYSRFENCRTTTPMSHDINLTQRGIKIVENLTRELKDYEQ